VLDALANVATIDTPQGEQAKKLLQRLWEHYSRHDHELLGWTAQAISTVGVPGFKETIKKANSKNKIDTDAHGSLEEFETRRSEPPVKNYRSLDHYSNLSDFYAVFSETRKRLNLPEKIEIEGQIDAAISDYFDEIKKSKEYLASLGFETRKRLNLPEKIEIEGQIDAAISDYFDEIKKSKEYLASRGFDDDGEDFDDDDGFYGEDDDELDGEFEELEDDDESLRIVQKPTQRQTPKIGRNDPCPCGSSKKYKQCCLIKK
jgi:hypothetical protein